VEVTLTELLAQLRAGGVREVVFRLDPPAPPPAGAPWPPELLERVDPKPPGPPRPARARSAEAEEADLDDDEGEDEDDDPLFWATGSKPRRRPPEPPPEEADA
jgi:NADPH-dependent 2,4-dienoyl-CoA reductase/sulfur reductase-like enzyme